MAAVEWLNSRPYYLNSSSTPFDYLWGSIWFLFDQEDYSRFGSGSLNLGCHIKLAIEIELSPHSADFNVTPVSGKSDIWFYNRFKLSPQGDVLNSHPLEETYRYSTDDGRIGIPFQFFNINTLQTFTQLSALTRRQKDQMMRQTCQTKGHLRMQFEYTLQPDHLGYGFPKPQVGAVPNGFLVQELRHPGRYIFTDLPPQNWFKESFSGDEIEISVSWDATNEPVLVNWVSNANLEIGPNRYNRTAEFTGEKVFLP